MKYFQGYYVKCTGLSDDLAVIFGRQVYKDKKSSFIQIITKDNTYNATFDASTPYTFKHKNFTVLVDKSYANKTGLYLNINTNDFTAKGLVTFGEFCPIKYDAMGPLKFFPRMECKHCVVSMRHSLNGQIILNGKIYDFDDGVGYIEGDRGRSFPRQYFWSQVNSDNVSLFASAARIPYLGMRFMGTICVANVDGKEHRFATYLGARVKEIGDKKLLIKQGKKILEIQSLDDKKGLPLFAPALGQMTRVIHESLAKPVKYKMTIGNSTLFEFSSDRAAFEYSDCRLPPKH